MAKIAAGSRPDSQPGSTTANLVAAGEGWAVHDILCTFGPQDTPFEERHAGMAIAVVLSGSFHYRCGTGRELMTAGSLFLGNAGECFTCGHEHATGDRCLSFSYTPEFFEQVAADAGYSARTRFQVPRLPPVREVAFVVAGAAAALACRAASDVFEELTLNLAGNAIRLDRGSARRNTLAEPGAEARVTRVLRALGEDTGMPHDLASLARLARLSPYHFLRTFERLTGTTPHQYLLRARLRRAAIRLRSERTKIADIALECGFGDVSNFNRTFRAEFGMNPRKYRG